jgi:hypothetical protein
MPLDATAPSDPQKSGLPELDISLTDISSKIPNEFKESMLLASQFGGAAVASGLANDLLRSEAFNAAMRNPLEATWWERNGSASTSETFYQTRCSLQSRVFGLDRAREDLMVSRGELRLSAEVIRKAAPDLTTGLEGSIEARAKAVRNLMDQTETLIRVVKAPEDRVLAEVAGALNSSTVSFEPHVRQQLIRYQAAVRQGRFNQVAEAHRNVLTHFATLTSEDSRGLLKSMITQVSRSDVLASLEHIDGPTLRSQVGSYPEFLQATKLFHDNSPIGRTLLKHADLAEKHLENSTRVLLAETELSAQRLLSNRSLSSPGQFLGATSSRFIASAGLSAGAIGAGVGADFALSKLLGTEAPILDGRDDGTRLAIDGCLVPSIIMSDLPTRIRFPLAAAAFAAGRMAPLMPTNDIIKPNHIDSLLIPAAVMSPLGGKYKAAAIAASIGIGRVANYLTG